MKLKHVILMLIFVCLVIVLIVLSLIGIEVPPPEVSHLTPMLLVLHQCLVLFLVMTLVFLCCLNVLCRLCLCILSLSLLFLFLSCLVPLAVALVAPAVVVGLVLVGKLGIQKELGNRLASVRIMLVIVR